MLQRSAPAEGRTRAGGRPEPDRSDIVLVDPRMRELYGQAERVASGRIAVLIVGETGVGKEHLAEFIHLASSRADQPFVHINCAAITESLFESELFGHERGAFTGADRAKPGLLEAAGQGTVFLDEIGELPLPLQAKLLRALEVRSAARVGGLEQRPVEARFVSATNRELERCVEDGQFRRDLYHRIAGVRLTVPPLRERKAEIPALAERFLSLISEELGRRRPVLTPAAQAALTAHPWRGNVREMRNAVERAVLLADHGFIGPQHLQLAEAPTQTPAAVDVDQPVLEPMSVSAESHRQTVLGALTQCGGNQTLAAARLGIGRRTLSRWLDELGLPRPRKGNPRPGGTA